MDNKWKTVSHDPGLTLYRVFSLAHQLLLKTYTSVFHIAWRKLSIIINAGPFTHEAARIRFPEEIQTILQLINACVRATVHGRRWQRYGKKESAPGAEERRKAVTGITNKYLEAFLVAFSLMEFLAVDTCTLSFLTSSSWTSSWASARGERENLEDSRWRKDDQWLLTLAGHWDHPGNFEK